MILTMSDLKAAYLWENYFIKVNIVLEDVCNWKMLKPLTQILIPEVEFHLPPKANESDHLSVKKTWDTTIHLVEKKSIDNY